MDIQSFISKFSDQLDETDPALLTPDTKFQELDEWSSLTAMLVIAFIKVDFDKNISGTEIRSCQTLNDLFTLVQSK